MGRVYSSGVCRCGFCLPGVFSVEARLDHPSHSEKQNMVCTQVEACALGILAEGFQKDLGG